MIERIRESAENQNWNKSRVKRAELLYSILEKYSKKLNKEINKLNLKDIKEALIRYSKADKGFISSSYQSTCTTIYILNEVLGLVDSEVRVNIDDLKEFIMNTDKGIYTKEEIQDICNILVNPQDKFIVYGLFCGIHGKENEEIRLLKESDVNLNRRIITLENREVEIDDFMRGVLVDTLDKDFGSIYHQYVDEDKEMKSKGYYELNMDSEYVIKTKPYSMNNYGLDAMKNAGIRRRLKRLSEIIGLELNPVKLVKSGIMSKMNDVKKEWTLDEISIFLRKNKTKAQRQELKRVFDIKYNKVIEGINEETAVTK